MAKKFINGIEVDGTVTANNISGSISGTNTGDETTGSIQSKRPLKTVGSTTIEGVGDIPLPDSVNSLPIVVTYNATISDAYTNLQPNRALTLTDNSDITITGTAAGDSAYWELYGTGTATLNNTTGTKVITVSGTKIIVWYIVDVNGDLTWHQDETGGGAVDLTAVSTNIVPVDNTKDIGSGTFQFRDANIDRIITRNASDETYHVGGAEGSPGLFQTYREGNNLITNLGNGGSTLWELKYNDSTIFNVNPSGTATATSYIGSVANTTFDASGFTKNLTTSDNTIQELATVVNNLNYDVYQNITGTGTTAIDLTLGHLVDLDLTSNDTLTFTPPAFAKNISLKIKQDATGSRTISFPSTFAFEGGVQPTLTTTAFAEDIINFYYNGTKYYQTSILKNVKTPEILINRINAGGLAVTATDGDLDWVRGDLSSGTGYTVNTGNNLATTGTTWVRGETIPIGLPDADFQSIFDSQKWDGSGAPEMLFTFTGLTAGNYKVNIYLGETSSRAVGFRDFDINIQGVSAQTGVDPTDLFGDTTAGMLTFSNIVVGGTTLTVEFIHGLAENPSVFAFEIIKI